MKKMFEIEEQLRTLLRLEFWGNIRLAGGVWVLLLVGRGFSLFQVGVAEAFFHVVSPMLGLVLSARPYTISAAV